VEDPLVDQLCEWLFETCSDLLRWGIVDDDDDEG